jgi:polysaccharide deacetylase family protein (PEP-CTERM system associated)
MSSDLRLSSPTTIRPYSFVLRHSSFAISLPSPMHVPPTIRHYLSVDLESAAQAENLRGRLRRTTDRALKEQLDQRVIPATRRLLGLFRQYELKACFFVSGPVAEKHPALLDEIAAAGHRLALHGYRHVSPSGLGMEDWRGDLEQALLLLRPWEAAWGRSPGYRAPNFGLNPELRMYHELAKAGIGWSSSLMRARVSQKDLLRADAAIRQGLLEGKPFDVETAAGSVREYPLAGYRLFDRLPLGWGGGFWLRAMPEAWNLSQMRNWQKAGKPFHLYLHPWEVDLEQPRVQLPAWRAFRQYHGMESLQERLEAIFAEFSFGGFE